jgi:hypothetical protein
MGQSRRRRLPLILEDQDIQIIRTLDDMRNRGTLYPVKATAEALGITQGRVRHCLFRAARLLDGLSRFVEAPERPQPPN